LGIHYLLRFWDTEYACQLDVSAIFGEHYGSLLASSRALVNLENELQSACMSTKLNQIGYIWNLSNNFKIHGESEEVAITDVVPNYTFYLHKFSGNFSHPLAIFPVDNSISTVICELKNQIRRPTCQWR
jgi:hypothetical protein